MVEIREYVDDRGRCPFRQWRARLDPTVSARVEAALARIADGSLASIKGLGGGVLECRLHFGPGYRIYFGRDGHALVILLAGGTKSRQHRDIERARGLWRDYKRRKREEV